MAGANLPDHVLEFLSKHGVLQKMQTEREKFEAKTITSQEQRRGSSNLDKLDFSVLKALREKQDRRGGPLKFSSTPLVVKKASVVPESSQIKRRNSVIVEADDEEGITQQLPVIYAHKQP